MKVKGGMAMNKKRFEVGVKNSDGVEMILGSTNSQEEFRRFIIKGLRCLSIIGYIKSIRTMDFVTKKEGMAVKEEGMIKICRVIKKEEERDGRLR